MGFYCNNTILYVRQGQREKKGIELYISMAVVDVE